MVQLACKYKMASLVEPAFSVEDPGLIPGLGRLPGEGNGYPLQNSSLENSMDYSLWGLKESDMTDQPSLHFMVS